MPEIWKNVEMWKRTLQISHDVYVACDLNIHWRADKTIRSVDLSDEETVILLKLIHETNVNGKYWHYISTFEVWMMLLFRGLLNGTGLKL